MFISIVVGIGIDYGIYVLFRYDEERSLGLAPDRALERTAERAGPGMLLGALTAAGAFLVLVLTDFQGIREFGVVSAIAIAWPAVHDHAVSRAAGPGRAAASAVLARPPPRARGEAEWLARVTPVAA